MNVEVAFYKHSSTFEFLPAITYNWVYSEKLNKTANTLMFSFLYWTLDIQWEISH